MIGWTGRNVPEKGTKVMRMMARLIENYNDMKGNVRIMIRGCYAPPDHEATEYAGIMKYLGHVNNAQEIFSTYLIHILPSRTPVEAQTQALLEAQSQTSIIIATDNGAIRYMINRCYTDKDLLIQMASDEVMEMVFFNVIKRHYLMSIIDPTKFAEIRVMFLQGFVEYGDQRKMAFKYAEILEYF